MITPFYARQGIPEMWLINVPNQQLEVYRNPSPKGYRQILLPDKKESISPILLPDVSIKISEENIFYRVVNDNCTVYHTLP